MTLASDASDKAQAVALEGRASPKAVEAWIKVAVADPADEDAAGFIVERAAGLGFGRSVMKRLMLAVRAQPESTGLKRLYALALDRMGDAEGALRTWRSLLKLDRNHAEAKREVLRLSRGAAPAAEGGGPMPVSIKTLMIEATQKEAAGDLVGALSALDQIAAAGGLNIGVQEAHDRIRHRLSGQIAENGRRVMLIGNCQVLGIAQSLRRLLPSTEITAVQWVTRQEPEAARSLLESLPGYDLVVAQPIGGKPLHPFRTQELMDRSRNFIGLPRLMFAGFHPDMVRHPELAEDRAGFRGWHSAIVAGAYRAGVPRRSAIDFFNAYAYGRLGYFDEIEKARALLLQEAAKVGFDLDRLLTGWLERGVFVNVPDHPKSWALHGVAEEICRRAGFETVADAEPPPDAQAVRLTWAVYPEIAARAGVEGDPVFRPYQPPTPMGFDQLVDHFYDFYDRHGSPSSPRIERVTSLIKDECRGPWPTGERAAA